MYFFRRKIKPVLKGIINKLGFEYFPKGQPPNPTFEVSDVWEAWVSSRQINLSQLKILQIGSSDGSETDFLYPALNRLKCSAFLVEPMPHCFELLQKRYSDKKDYVTFFNVAIGPSDALLPMYHVAPNGHFSNTAFFRTLASFDRQHLLNHGIPYNEIISTEIPFWTIKHLYAACKISSPDLLLVDAEGLDAKIVTEAIKMSSTPQAIIFEFTHISKCERTNLYNLLTIKGYKFIHGVRDTLALRY
jgi:FkbM family methyltransferase